MHLPFSRHEKMTMLTKPITAVMIRRPDEKKPRQIQRTPGL
jgi:hypothetical protein